MKISLLFAFYFNLILGLDVVKNDSLLFQSAEKHAHAIAHTLLTGPQVRGYKTRQQKKQKAEQEKIERAEPTVAVIKDKTDANKGVIPASDKNKVWISKTAETTDTTPIRQRLEKIVQNANLWITNNIARHGQKDQFKARRLVERYNALPDRVMQVVGRCRDPETLDQLQTLRASRPLRKENKARMKAQRSVERAQKYEEQQAAKLRAKEEKTESKTVRRRRQASKRQGGSRYRPGRMEKKPVRYLQYLIGQIEKKKLQRNELRCDNELHPECAQKGKKGQQARKKFRPDPREAMWTKINRALRLSGLEVRDECHIWSKIEKKVQKLKVKSHKIYSATRARLGLDKKPKQSKKQILAAQKKQEIGRAHV